MRCKSLLVFITVIVLPFGQSADSCNNGSQKMRIPEAIRAIMEKPRYADSTWGLRLVVLHTGGVIHNLTPGFRFETGSVRKLFSVAAALNEFGREHRFITPVHRQGEVDEKGGPREI